VATSEYSQIKSAPQKIVDDYKALKMAGRERDRAMVLIGRAREGDYEAIAPDLFNDENTHPYIANFIDTAARDLAELIGQMPSLSCSAGTMKSEADKKRASNKNKIGSNYWFASELESQLLTAADQYISYGFLPMYVEPNFDKKLPSLFLEDPQGCYYSNDRWGKTRKFAKTWKETCKKLAAMFPECASRILQDSMGRSVDPGTKLEIVRYVDDDMCYLLLPEKQILLESYANVLPYCPAVVIERPGLKKGKPRGQFDDIIWVQVARAFMVRLTMEAGVKSVYAPTVVPRDVVELNIGEDAIIQTDNPAGVGKVKLDVPQAAFGLSAELQQEMETGARYPNARTGSIQASVVTGKGVDALMGTMNTQVRAAQIQLAKGIRSSTSMMFEMDEKLWPRVVRNVEGSLLGESYKLSYTPAKDIAGIYSCQVDYGLAMGQSPQNATVMMLQLQGAGLLSSGTIMRNLPLPIDAEDESRSIDVENTRKTLMAALAGMGQALPQIAASGGDPTDIVKMLAQVIRDRQNSKSIEDSLEAFYKKKAADAAAAAQQQAPQGPDDGSGGEPGAFPDPNAQGGPPGVPPGAGPPGPPGAQAGAPQALPDLATLVSQIRNGKAQQDASIIRRQAI
jgi:hypothetical protein